MASSSVSWMAPDAPLGRKLIGSGGLVLLGFCFLAWPDLLMRGSFVERVTHDHTLPVTAMLAVTLFFIQLGIAYNRRQGVSPGRRETVAAVMFLLILEAPILMVVLPEFRQYRLARDLVAHGVSTQARLVRTMGTGCGKAACSDELFYSFTPAGTQQPVSGSVEVTHSRGEVDPAYSYAVDTQTVPILYDPQAPGRSMLYWQDRIARRASLRDTLSISGILLAIPLVFWACMMAIGLHVMRKKRRKQDEEAG